MCLKGEKSVCVQGGVLGKRVARTVGKYWLLIGKYIERPALVQMRKVDSTGWRVKSRRWMEDRGWSMERKWVECDGLC